MTAVTGAQAGSFGDRRDPVCDLSVFQTELGIGFRQTFFKLAQAIQIRHCGSGNRNDRSGAGWIRFRPTDCNLFGFVNLSFNVRPSQCGLF